MRKTATLVASILTIGAIALTGASSAHADGNPAPRPVPGSKTATVCEIAAAQHVYRWQCQNRPNRPTAWDLYWPTITARH